MEKEEKMAAKRLPRQNSHITKLSRGLRVRTYELPPTDFNPLTASARKLLHHGFPARPDAKTAPELRKKWDREFSRPRTWIMPVFREVTGKSHRRARLGGRPRARVSALSVTAGASSTNWSGSVASPPASRNFAWIEGQWTVPNPHAPTFDNYYAAEWIGLDGLGAFNLLQAGTGTDVGFAGLYIPHQQAYVYAWWEWLPGNEVWISNLPVSAGDVMYCLICVNSPTTATIYMSNQSTLVSTSFTVTASQGASVVGTTAEWIVERPLVNGDNTKLADYKTVYFDEGIAGLSGGPFQIVTLGSGSPVTMINDSGESLSVPTFETSQLMKVDWVKAI
jgi:hypothetical protein